MQFSELMFYTIAGLSLLNFVRIAAMLLGADLYDIRQLKRRGAQPKRKYQPLITVVIPAFNEEIGVIRTLESVLASDYQNKQVLVVNDGSTDRTKQVVRNFQRRHPGACTLINQQNGGKARAINRAVKYWAKGSLIMVVDADSILDRKALGNMVAHFRNRRVVASAANVKIIPTKALLGIVQRFEYLISYRMKRASTVMNMEYIVGGVGSTFRKSALLRVGLYDTDTMTEDIDVTLKIIKHYGNSYYLINYAADAVTYTEHVTKFASLIRQRFRWKYGRMQALLKNNALFFSRKPQYKKLLTWYQLPYAIIGEAVLLLEPLLVGYIVFVVAFYFDVTSLISVYVIVSGFVFLMILGEDTETLRSKTALCLLLPALYILLYILTIVELVALFQSLARGKRLIRRQDTASHWQHVERTGGTVTLP